MARESDLATLKARIEELDAASNDRLADAEALLAAGRYASAISLGLYALEIRLKERICRRLDLPALPRAFEIHDLGGLLIMTGLSRLLDDPAESDVKANWVVIEKWSRLLNTLRYSPEVDPRWSSAEAHDFFQRIRDLPHGVLPWLLKPA